VDSIKIYPKINKIAWVILLYLLKCRDRTASIILKCNLIS